MLKLLEEKFGFTGFLEGQQDVIELILSGKSAAAIFPTGKGKSLCYQLPATQLNHLTLVVSPLLSLIQDQLEFLKAKRIPSARIDSTLSRDEEIEIMNNIKAGKIKILMISVERFNNERFRNFLQQVPISLMVIDEAHCISEWGHNFRPDYLKLPQFQLEFKIPQVLLLTATATPEVSKDMCSKFNIPDTHVISTGFYRENLHLKVLPVVSDNDKRSLILSLLKKGQSAIIYVTLQKSAEEVATFLTANNVNASYYHAGLSNEERTRIQDRFMKSETDVIVATIAFGMGIDKRDIRMIIHYDLPKSIENYSQEIGRAGRDSEVSECILFGNKDNIQVLQNFIYGDTPEFSAIDFIIHEIPTDGSIWEIQAYALSKLADIRLLPLKTLLVYLELKGIIRSRYSYFKNYRFKYLVEQDQIVSKFDGERKQFVSDLLGFSVKARVWNDLDIDNFCKEYAADRQRVLAALDYFEQQNFLQVETKEFTESFEVLSTNFDATEVARTMHEHFKAKENSELARISAMVAYFEHSRCLSYSLAAYFGQKMEKEQCGHCSACLEGTKSLSESHQLKPIAELPVRKWVDEFAMAISEKPSTDLITRFLCGINTPRLMQVKAKKMEGFGKLEDYPYKEVKNQVIRASFGM